ncbi:hypothetical protein [Clostridium oceanicum]|uniref:Uncharacterized protein n=1 Tax=Clostridium oceanicum TaxID=1543 RepID=A0ABN1J9P1_9CLOT
MKYIGPFLRINTLKTDNIYSQLNFLAKESLNHIVLNSNCGICTPVKSLSNSNINAFKTYSPLLCVYKKASPKLTSFNDRLIWNEDKFKKEIDVLGNSLMTLSLLQLIEYYNNFKDTNKKLYSYSELYSNLCKKQLEFYALNLRNEEGIFVDKLDVSDSSLNDLKFKQKNKKFNFSNQALLMAAYYGCSKLGTDDYCSNYEKFSLDILNMLIEFKDEIYSLSLNELSKICLGLNLFYGYSKNPDSKILLLDLSELLLEKYSEKYASNTNFDIDESCLTYFDFISLYKNTGISKFKLEANNLFDSLHSLYDDNLSMFIKQADKKEITYSSTEIMSYFLTMLSYSNNNENSVGKSELTDFFKTQVLSSGIILSWPDAPSLNSVERYRNHSLKSDDLIDEQYFRSSSIDTPENTELAPVFAKYVLYNNKKQEFTKTRLSFDSNKNLLILFLILYTLKPI